MLSPIATGAVVHSTSVASLCGNTSCAKATHRIITTSRWSSAASHLLARMGLTKCRRNTFRVAITILLSNDRPVIFHSKRDASFTSTNNPRDVQIAPPVCVGLV